MLLFVHINAKHYKEVMGTTKYYKALLCLMMLFLTYSSPLHAYQFQNFTLKGDLDNLNQSESKSSSVRSGMGIMKAAKSEETSEQDEQLRNLIGEKLLKLAPNKAGGFGDKEPLLLKKIGELLANEYINIGQEQTGPLVLNHDIGGGTLNFSGFTWRKPLANFTLYANRELAPDLFEDRWIVHDTFVIGVDASTYLTNLKEEDLIDISDEGIGAFAGISFHRVYHYYHFSDTFLSGLQSDFSKLFLSFTKFNPNHIKSMPQYEILKKQDKFSFNAGGFVSSPPMYGLSARAGVLVNIAFENELTLQATGDQDGVTEGEFLRLSVDKKFNVSADAHLSLQVDFFNILKLTILSYDLEYEYAKSKKVHLSFYEEDKKMMAESKDHAREFNKLVRGLTDKAKVWKDNIIQLDERKSQNLNSKYSILLFGKVRKTETEQVHIIRDGEEKVFYKHYSQSIKFIQNLWSRILNIAVFKIFEFETAIKHASESTKKMNVEYEKLDHLNKETVDSEEKFSFELIQKFSAAKTHRWIDGLYRKESKKYISRWTTLDSKYVDMIDNKSLRGPLSISSKLLIERAGLVHFHQLHEDDVFKVIVDACGTKRKRKWLNPRKRRKMLRRVQFGKSACVKKIGNRYLDYINDFKALGQSNLKRFRRFLGPFFKNTRYIGDIYSIFGAENIFNHGTFSATTQDGTYFNTYFKSGQFRGLGVIDNYLRDGQGTITRPIQ